MSLFRKKTPEDAFRTAVEKTIRRLGTAGSIEHDEDLFALHLEDGGTIMLGNLFARWRTLGVREAGAYLESAVAGLLAATDRPPTFDEARNLLRPGIRDRSTLESSRWMAELGGSVPIAIPHRALGSRTVAVLLLDHPTTMTTVSAEFLSDWDVSFEDAFEVAVDNLGAATERAEWATAGGGTYVSTWNDEYDASRILVPEVLERLEVDGEPVAFVPHRNRLIVTGSNDPAGLGLAMQLTESALDEPGQISAAPLAHRDGVWIDLELPDTHLAKAGLDRLLTIDGALAYDATTSIIQAVVGQEVFVANSILAERDGVIASTATWIDAPCIIPRTDRIMFYRSDVENWMVAWEDAERVVGHLMEQTRFYPPRYRVERFPTGSELDAMPTISD